MKYLFSIVLLSIASLPSTAQKLPSTQQSNIYITQKIVVDGKASEINNKYQAYNRTTDLYYTLQNDEMRLYLVVNIKDPEVIKKAIGGGITFSVNASGKRNDTVTYSVTYPQMFSSDKSAIAKNINKLSDLTGDTTERLKQADSINKLNNTLLTMFAKQILLKKISAIPDSIISVYNEYGIKACMQFNQKSGLTYEMIVPLQYLNLKAGNEQKFIYNIMLNGVLSLSPGVVRQTAKGPVSVIGVPRGFFNSTTFNDPSLKYPTDFWADYILAKKP
jgi:hypothetical protein